jgi:hypothetical protein
VKHTGPTHIPTCTGSAIFDATGAYRYSLKRAWSDDYPQVTFIMLNPSRADEVRNDPTISRCLGFASAWGFGSLEVVNLFAYCTSSPAELRRASDPIGEENDQYLMQATTNAHTTVLAWGTYGTMFSRNRQVLDLLLSQTQMGGLYCLGLTKDGHPRHPLYLKKGTRPKAFSA